MLPEKQVRLYLDFVSSFFKKSKKCSLRANPRPRNYSRSIKLVTVKNVTLYVKEWFPAKKPLQDILSQTVRNFKIKIIL